jgi:hypothetical protein
MSQMVAKGRPKIRSKIKSKSKMGLAPQPKPFKIKP